MKRLLILLLLVLSGCKAGPADRKAEKAPHPDSGPIRGDYLYGHEVRALRPCGEQEDLWVIDPSGLLAELHGKLTDGISGEARMKVVARGRRGPAPAEGYGADYPGSVTIDEVIYAAFEGMGCGFDLSAFVFRASGNEPFWMVEVKPGSMKLSRPGSPDLFWNDVSREDSGDEIVFRGADGDLPAVLTILPGPGHDDMSGAYYHHRARFRWGDHDLQGSALEGQAVRTP